MEVVVGKSVFGSIVTISLLMIARFTLQDWAIIGTIIASSITAGYTSYKWVKELRSDLRNGKKKLPFKKQRP